MKAIQTVLVALAQVAMLATFATSAGCERATEEKCREAVRNVFRITKVDDTQNAGPDESAAIRSCRANSSRQTVDCVIAAKTLDDLAACEGDIATKNQDQATDEVAPVGDEADDEAAPAGDE